MKPLGEVMVDIQDVLTKVLERTREGKIAWKNTGATDRFTATIGASVMYVAEGGGSHSFVVLDSSGMELGRLESHVMRNQLAPLRELLGLARRQALGVDDRLSGLMAELDRI